MVRLKALPTCKPRRTICSFQFHYGTIKRKTVCHQTSWQDDFNSTMVRLKAYRIYLTARRYYDFNSTMVRLKDLQVRNLDLTNQFQFHYGTIKSSCPSPG